MADKRINALANTASSTASDDFIAVDGTTNGTRKLSAFSPTFGGNATVTGTLTVNGVATAGSYLTSAAGLTFPGALSANGYYLYSGSANGLTMYGYGSTYDVYIGNRAGTRALSVAANSTVVSIPDTTASTTTSTGALVVGNGTSGGLGVGGNTVVGGASFTTGDGSGGPYIANSSVIDHSSGQARFYGRGANTSTRATMGFYSTYSNGTGGLTLQTFDTSGHATFSGSLTTGADTSLVAIYIPGDSALRAAAGKMYLDTKATDGGDIVLRPRTNAALTLAAATGNATFASTTNASSTSFAALVVNGGVGVGKRIVSGEGLTTNGDNDTHISFVRNGTVSIGPTSSAAPKLSISSAVVLAAATQSLSAWGDIGAQFAVSGSVLTDTQSSGTVSRCVLNSFASTNVAAAGATTFTQAATLFVAGGPTAGTNVTITNAYAIYTAGGRINFQGLPTSSAGLQAGTLWNDSGTLKVA